MKLAMPSNCPRGRTACGLACLLLYVCFQLFAGVPKLHNWIHSDSDSATHQCELTLLTQGQVNITSNEGLIKSFVSLLLPAVPLTGVALVSSARCQLPPGRAPPLA